jgi:hypothetical protein
MLTVNRADIFYAFQNMREPAFPLLAPSGVIMSTWPQPPPSIPTLQNMTSGFAEFRAVDEFVPLMQAITNARLITIGLAMYLSGHPEAPSLNRIVWARNFLTHDLLSLPLALPYRSPTHTPPDQHSYAQNESFSPSANANLFSSSHALYNLIRLSTLAYTLLVLFPLPRITGVHAKLSQKLMLALDDCIVLELWTTHASILLWATVLGGAVAEQDGLKPWFAGVIRQARSVMPHLTPADSARNRAAGRQSQNSPRSSAEAVSKREADATWVNVRDICFRFLWFGGRECDGVARAFWDEARENAVMGKGIKSEFSTVSAPL